MSGSGLKPAFERARCLFQRGYTQPALDVVEVQLNENPEDGELLFLKASILHSEARWRDALDAIEVAACMIPLPISGQLVLADCYSHLGKHDLALTAYEHLLELSPLPVEYYAGLYAGFKRAGKLEQALACCRKAIEIDPENDEAYFGLAHCMSDLAFAPRQITSILRKTVELAPEKAQYRMSLVIQLMLTKRLNEAYGILCQGEPDILEKVSCKCVTRHLMNLCAWAGDERRCSILGTMLAKLSNPKRPSIEAEVKND